MKRNNELMAKILLEMRELSFSYGWHEIKMEGHSEEEVSYHVWLLYQMGLIDAKDVGNLGSSFQEWKPKTILPLGHDFLDAVENEGLWNKFITTMKEEGPRVIVLESLRQAIASL